MNRCYRERLGDIVVMASPTATRAAAEFTVNGTYLATDAGPAGGAGADLCPARRWAFSR
jgi:hypothetical protein